MYYALGRGGGGGDSLNPSHPSRQGCIAIHCAVEPTTRAGLEIIINQPDLSLGLRVRNGKIVNGDRKRKKENDKVGTCKSLSYARYANYNPAPSLL